MAIKDVLKVNRKTFFNPRAWLGYDYLKRQTLDIYNLTKGLFSLPPALGRSETYEEALVRLNITNANAQKTGRQYFIYSFLFFVFSSATFVFSFILLFYYGSFLGWLLGIAVSILLGAQAFRFNFWYFQIKNKKLGCTFEEWKNNKISEDEAPK